MNTRFGLRYFRFSCPRLAVFAAGFLACTSTGRAAEIELVAHRGGYLFAPENTRASFRACSGLVDRIEFDVRVSADGELVLMHDDTVDRTTDGTGAVTNLTLAQLKNLDAGIKFSPAFVHEQIPTLAEALTNMPPGITAMVHCKVSWLDAILNTLRANNAVSNVLIASDDWIFLRDLNKAAPEISLCLVGSSSNISPTALTTLKYYGVGSVSWDKAYVTPEIVDRVHAYGLRIYAWSINDSEIQTFMDMGVDGLLVDNPPLANQWVHSAPPSNEQLANGLAAYWKLDDGLLNPAATNVEDVETHSDARLVGFGAPPSWLAGDNARAGGALRLDGINDCVLLPTNGFLDIGTNAVSISLWVNLSVLPSQLPSNKPYAGIYDAMSDSYVVYLDRNSDINGELRFKVTDSSLQAARPGIPSARLQTGVWHHVVGVFDGSAGPAAGQAMIYLDGRIQDVHIGSDATFGYGLTNGVRRGQAAAIGRNGTEAVNYFAGAVDEVAIWRRALTPADVKQIYSAGTNGLPLERKVMTIWITHIDSIPDSSDLQLDIRVDHGSMTNQPLYLRGAAAANAAYVEQAVSAGFRGHKTNLRVPFGATAPHSGPANINDPDAPRFFQIVCP
jgi:glycerophosphoryl diester phosphodiesterase